MRSILSMLATAAIVGFAGCSQLHTVDQGAALPHGLQLTEQRVSSTYEAISRADTEALRALLSDSLRWISPTSGAVLRKPQLLGAAARMPAAVTIRYVVDSVRIWQSGSTASAEYRLSDSRTFAAQTNTFTSRGLDLFSLEAGTWRLRQHTQTWVPRSPAFISADTASLRAFVGRYDRGNGFVDDVHLEPSGLMATSSAEKRMGVPGAHLLPVSENAFSPEGSAPLIVFERDGTGRVTGYVQQQPDGIVARARRLADP